MPDDKYANERRAWRSQTIRRATPPVQTVPMPPPPPPAARLRAAADLFPEMLKTLTAAAEALAERDAAAQNKDEKLRDLRPPRPALCQLPGGEAMTGRIISEPTPEHSCQGKPAAEKYEPGTAWQCDDCGRVWVVIQQVVGERVSGHVWHLAPPLPRLPDPYRQPDETWWPTLWMILFVMGVVALVGIAYGWWSQ